MALPLRRAERKWPPLNRQVLKEAMMRDWQSQAHVKRYCKYHAVFVSKHRKKSIYGALRKDIGGILRGLCRPTWSGIGRGICDERPYLYAVDDSAEVQCGQYHRISESEISDQDIQGLPAGKTELCRAPFLGARLLREYCRIR